LDFPVPGLPVPACDKFKAAEHDPRYDLDKDSTLRAPEGTEKKIKEKEKHDGILPCYSTATRSWDEKHKRHELHDLNTEFITPYITYSFTPNPLSLRYKISGATH